MQPSSFVQAGSIFISYTSVSSLNCFLNFVRAKNNLFLVPCATMKKQDWSHSPQICNAMPQEVNTAGICLIVITKV